MELASDAARISSGEYAEPSYSRSASNLAQQLKEVELLELIAAFASGGSNVREVDMSMCGLGSGCQSGLGSGYASGTHTGTVSPDAAARLTAMGAGSPGGLPPDFLPTGARSGGTMSAGSGGSRSLPGSGSNTPQSYGAAQRGMGMRQVRGMRSSGNQSDEEAGGNIRRRRRQDNREEDRMLYALNLARVRAGEDQRTTLMVRNIPNKYNQKMLLATIEDRHEGKFDLLYLPIDFKNRC